MEYHVPCSKSFMKREISNQVLNLHLFIQNNNQTLVHQSWLTPESEVSNSKVIHDEMADLEKTKITIFASFGTVMTALVILAMVGSGICFKLTHRLLKNKPALLLVLNLNICDILVALVSWASFMAQHIATMHGVQIHIFVHKLIWSVLVTLGNVTILTLLGLAGDCFLALRIPLHYQERVTFRNVRIFMALTWMVSAICGFGDFISATGKIGTMKDAYEKRTYWDALRDTIILPVTNKLTENLVSSVTLILSNSLSFLCLILMVLIYSYIFLKIKKIHQSNIPIRGQAQSPKSQINTIRTTLLIFLSFILLWVPTLTMNIIAVVKPGFLSKFSLVEATVIGYTADTMLILHSIVDGVIYGLRVRKNIKRQKRIKKVQHSLYSDYQRTIQHTSSCSSLRTWALKLSLSRRPAPPSTIEDIRNSRPGERKSVGSLEGLIPRGAIQVLAAVATLPPNSMDSPRISNLPTISENVEYPLTPVNVRHSSLSKEAGVNSSDCEDGTDTGRFKELSETSDFSQTTSVKNELFERDLSTKETANKAYCAALDNHSMSARSKTPVAQMNSLGETISEADFDSEDPQYIIHFNLQESGYDTDHLASYDNQGCESEESSPSSQCKINHAEDGDRLAQPLFRPEVNVDAEGTSYNVQYKDLCPIPSDSRPQRTGVNKRCIYPEACSKELILNCTRL